MLIIYFASVLDYLLGDPWGWIHPVQLMGWVINTYTNFILKNTEHKLLRKIAGFILCVVLVIGSGVMTWLLIDIATKINNYFGIVIQVILLASCFAGKSLRCAAEDVLQYLRKDDLPQARYRLSFYVGRDTDNLSTDEVFRAILETVAENTTDGVTAPLFYALLGVFIPVIGCVPLAIAYKALSTLDSMIGYKKEPFIDIGWFSARLEDYITWLPCRLTVLTLAIISGDVKNIITECKQYAIQDPSPNSGWSEGIYAVILGIQLGGENTYKGEKKFKPLLGKPINKIDENIIQKTLLLTRYCFLSWIFFSSLIFIMI
ncbi:adenosylcobinamide-phosphate synthase [Geminocystis sp. NIES-3708]|uniref:adenosylcobinamide-phosphate synthase CbiB n=1 Tax=Geminocystis sp. NIES-3708 TaxID=1615909 RepID=UPI0005FC6A44|nr:adenosylcobinamide-phosphate synthase CbiB [Geminocystis sp. NIES-3708]BAQ60612.1 adenosylcobinamide-phosphate synthase [Geminocystis sp. NIES-3708]